MKENLIIYIIISLFTSYVIAYYIGRKRKIGFWVSLLVCNITTPLIGLIITIFSDKVSNFVEKTNQKLVFGWIFIIVYGFSFFAEIIVLIRGKTKINETIETFLICIGMVLLGYYLIKIGRKQKEKNNLKLIEPINQNL